MVWRGRQQEERGFGGGADERMGKRNQRSERYNVLEYRMSSEMVCRLTLDIMR